MTTDNERTKGKGEELTGKVKQGVGKLIGDEKMEAEGVVEKRKGQTRQESAKAAERGKGAGEEVTGKIKGAAGNVLDDKELQAEGKADELKGKARRKANQ